MLHDTLKLTLTLQLLTAPDGYDFTIRTPGTPPRWVEMDQVQGSEFRVYLWWQWMCCDCLHVVSFSEVSVLEDFVLFPTPYTLHP